MKNTVFTVIAVLLMLATLCLPAVKAFERGAKEGEAPPPPPPPAAAAAPTWRLKASWAGPNDHYVPFRPFGIHDIEFRDNHQVFYGRGDRLYKWDFVTGRAQWIIFHDTDPDSGRVENVEVPRRNSRVVIHSVNGDRTNLYIRDADDLRNVIVSKELHRNFVKVLKMDVDSLGDYLIAEHTASDLRGLFDTPVPFWDVVVWDIWGGNGWQFRSVDEVRRRGEHGDIRMHPTHQSPPRWYRQADRWNDERFREYTSSHGNVTDTYITTRSGHIDRMAITVRYGRTSNNYTRLAALDSDNLIYVWNYSGDFLFDLNLEGYAAHNDILEFTPNGELLVTAYERDVRFWDVSQRALDHSFRIPEDDMPAPEVLSSLAISDNGKLMAIGDGNGTVYIYEWTGGSAPAAPAQKPEQQVTALLSNYPNPFNPETWIPYQLAEAAEVQVSIHSADGQLVRKLELGQVPAGVYSDKDRAAYWDGRNAQGEPVASGVYFYTLQAGEFSATRQMVIRK